MKNSKKLIALTLTATMIGSMAVTNDVSAKKKKNYSYLCTLNEEYLANQEGKLFKETVYKNTYDKNGNQTASKIENYDQEGKLSYTSSWKTKFDKKNRIKSDKSYTDGKLVTAAKYTYKKNKYTKKTYDEKNKCIEKAVTKTTKKKETTITYNAKGKKLFTYVITYDKKGNPIKEVGKKGKKVTETVKRTYKKNVITKFVSKSFTEEGKLSTKHEETYKKGIITKSNYVMYEDGDFNTSYVDTYSYKGKYVTLTQETKSVYDDDVIKTVDKYKVDKAGNNIYSWSKEYINNELKDNITYKNELYTSGKVKGCLKKKSVYRNGKLDRQSTYKIKRFTIK